MCGVAAALHVGHVNRHCTIACVMALSVLTPRTVGDGRPALCKCLSGKWATRCGGFGKFCGVDAGIFLFAVEFCSEDYWWTDDWE